MLGTSEPIKNIAAHFWRRSDRRTANEDAFDLLGMMGDALNAKHKTDDTNI